MSKKTLSPPSLLNRLELALDSVFAVKSPVQLAPDTRLWIARYAWVFELVFVIFGSLAFLTWLGALGFISRETTTAGVVKLVGFELLMAWLTLLILGVQVVVGGMAVPRLKNMRKIGWDLAYYVMLFNALYGIANYLAYPSLLNLISHISGAIIGLFFLFQIRAHFKA